MADTATGPITPPSSSASGESPRPGSGSGRGRGSGSGSGSGTSEDAHKYTSMQVMVSRPASSSNKTDSLNLDSAQRWEDHKHIIQRLYIDEDMHLKDLVETMKNDYNFFSTPKTFKARFRLWGWRKYKLKDEHLNQQHIVRGTRRAKTSSKHKASAAAVSQSQPPSQAQSQIVQRRLSSPSLRTSLASPDAIKDQELPILISGRYTIDRSGTQRWTCTLINMSGASTRSPRSQPASPNTSSVVVRFCDAELEYVKTIHHLKAGRTRDGFENMNKLFDNMAGSTLYTHPKWLTGFWMVCAGLQNASAWYHDSGFEMMRQFILFHAANAAACFRAASSGSSSPQTHPVVALMCAVARMAAENPGNMRATFLTAYTAAAASLEAELGPEHPIVLVTWTDLYWYFNQPIDARAVGLEARQRAALARADAGPGGRAGDVSVGILHNLTFYLFYCVADDAGARIALADLLSRTSARMAEAEAEAEAEAAATALPAPSSLLLLLSSSAATTPAGRPANFWIQRAHAFGSLLAALLVLEDEGDEARSRAVVGDAIAWLRTSPAAAREPDAPMHAAMLAFDLGNLVKAWGAGLDLRTLTLSLAKPRSINYNQT